MVQKTAIKGCYLFEYFMFPFQQKRERIRFLALCLIWEGLFTPWEDMRKTIFWVQLNCIFPVDWKRLSYFIYIYTCILYKKLILILPRIDFKKSLTFLEWERLFPKKALLWADSKKFFWQRYKKASPKIHRQKALPQSNSKLPYHWLTETKNFPVLIRRYSFLNCLKEFF